MRSETLDEGMMHEIEYTESKNRRTIVPKAPHKSSSKHRDSSYQEREHTEIAKCDPDRIQTRDQEWTTTKKIVNHKTRQVETRVQRQLVMEDGKVIADSGPQIITRVREDSRNEQHSNDHRPPPLAPSEGWLEIPEHEVGKVMGEKKEVSVVSREVREENMQYHDERIKQLTGKDVHRRALTAPNELITINDKKHPDYYHRKNSGSDSDHDSDVENKNNKSVQHLKGQQNGSGLFSRPPRGKMVHYSAKGKKYQDTDEIHTTSKLAADGSIIKEVKHTKHHEEFSDDEEPDRDGTAPREPIATKQTRQHVEYLHDYSSDSSATSSSLTSVSRKKHNRSRTHHHHQDNDDKKDRNNKNKEKSFQRYSLQPTATPIVSQNDDYRDSKSWVRHTFEKTDRPDSHSSNNSHDDRKKSSSRASGHRSIDPIVPVPDEYKIHREKLAASKHQSSSSRRSKSQSVKEGRSTNKSPSPERSYSPAKSHRSHHSHHSHRGSQRSLSNLGHHGHHKEDASVQATLTDEELEHPHGKSGKSLQRKSTSKSQRSYYFGESNDTSDSLNDNYDDKQNRPSKSHKGEHKDKHHSRHYDHEASSHIGLRPISPDTDVRARSPTHSDQIYSISRRPGSKNSLIKTKTTTQEALFGPSDDSKREKRSSSKSPTKMTSGKQTTTTTTVASKSKQDDGKVRKSQSPLQQLTRKLFPSSPSPTKDKERNKQDKHDKNKK